LAHDHPHLEHDHSHGQEPTVAPGEAFDAGQQSLVDALRSSFRVLKFVMVLVVVFFLGSGIFIVDRDKEVKVRLRFGEQDGVFRDGIHWAFPYPIDQVIRVPIAAETLMLDSFWFQLREDEKTRALSDLMSRGPGLEPGVDGALLTGDRAIMHMLIQAQYTIRNADEYVQNVVISPDRKDEKDLLRSVLKNAATAAAARTTASVVAKEAGTVASEIRSRAQAVLDQLRTGIQLDQVAASQSYYPLQVKDAVVNVSTAESQKNETIQKARQGQQQKLNEAAGEAWKDLWIEIQKLDQLADGPGRDAALARIENLLTTRAAGKAGQRIQEAQQESHQIVLATQSRQNQFNLLLEPYQSNPVLFRQRMLTDALTELYAQPGVVKWMLPGGNNKQINLWLNPDPKESKEASEREAGVNAKAKGGG
jgi:modulator of FtsH protease HflK